MSNFIRKHRLLVHLGTIVLAVSVATAGFYAIGAFDTWQDKIYDRLFLKRSPDPNIVIVAIDNASLETVGQWPWQRRTFAELIDKLQQAETIGIDINFSEPSRFGTADDRALARAIATSEPRIIVPIQTERGVIVAEPTAALSDVGERGFINTRVDADGVVRDALVSDDDRQSFGAMVVGADTAALPQHLRLDYVGPAHTFLTLSAVDVLEGSVPPRVFENAFVLIGATARDLQDYLATPFGQMPGVEYHANVVQFLRSGTPFSDTPPAYAAALLTLIAAATAGVVYATRRLLLLFALLSVMFLAIVLGSFAAFSYHIVVPVLYLGFSFFAASAATTIFQYITESREKQFIRNTFQYYLAPDALEELLQNPEKVKLGGETRTVTILFSDIRGFTTIAESLSPEELTAVLNIYLTAMTDVIMEQRGVIDKYIGDAIMAFWGAPVENPTHAPDACRAVVAMSAALRTLNERFEAEGRPTLNFGVGLNTGEVVVGNMGSERRFDYTIMGDEVNFASRLEGLTKQYGVEALVSESVHTAAGEHADITFRNLDLVTVKGQTRPRRIYQLVTEPPTEKDARLLAHFEQGRSAYEKGDFTGAVRHFKKALSVQDDAPSWIFLERSHTLLANPPKDWQGVYTFTEK